MNIHNHIKEVPTKSLENEDLVDAIRLIKCDSSKKTMDNFIKTLLSSSLIVLIDDFIHEDLTTFDQDSSFSLSRYDNIPLVKFEDEEGQFVFPVFTDVSHVETLPYFEGFIPLIVPALQVLEMAQKMTCDRIIFNFEGSTSFKLEKTLIDSLVFRLISEGELSLQNTFM